MPELPIVADPVFFKSVADKVNYQIDFTDALDSGELLTGTPTVTVTAPAAPTLNTTNSTINTADTVVLGKTRVAGQVLKGTLDSGEAAISYVCKIVVDTTSITTPQLTRYFYVNVITEPTEVEAAAAVSKAHIEAVAVESLSTIDQLKHIRANFILRINELSEQLKPSYTSSGGAGASKTVHWTEYLAQLQKGLNAVNAQISGLEMYEVHTIGYS